MLNEKKTLKQFPLNSGTRHECSLSLLLSNKILKCPKQVRLIKLINRIPLGMEGIKRSIICSFYSSMQKYPKDAI